LDTIKENSYIDTEDFLVTGEEFSLVRNKEYGFLETRPHPESKDLAKYYQSEDYISHTDSKKGALAFLYQMVKSYSLVKKVRLISKLNSGKGSLLDIGAGTGEFLRVAQRKGWVISGVEPNEGARNFACKKNITLDESIAVLEGRTFDVVTLWHVLEHMTDLQNTIQKIQQLVKTGGTLVVAVPNFNSFDAKHYKNYWAAFDVPRHLWHFSQDAMRKIFSSELQLVKTKPLIFDSFYVSLLSEKYKSGNLFSIKAFFIGLLSNLMAWRNKEYSSLIYCYKKTK
jgi:SAM-dependent methyltransferase